MVDSDDLGDLGDLGNLLSNWWNEPSSDGPDFGNSSDSEHDFDRSGGNKKADAPPWVYAGLDALFDEDSPWAPSKQTVKKMALGATSVAAGVGLVSSASKAWRLHREIGAIRDVLSDDAIDHHPPERREQLEQALEKRLEARNKYGMFAVVSAGIGLASSIALKRTWQDTVQESSAARAMHPSP